jgi:hypothetical protein
MNTIIICGALALILFVTLLYHKEHFINPPTPLTESQDFSDESLLRSVIPNAPAPAGTDQTEKLMYSNTDLEANIVDIKKKINLVNMNMPAYVRQEVASQLATNSCTNGQ